MSHGELNSPGNPSITSSQTENGYMEPLSVFDSEKVVQDFLQEPSVRGVDEHLVEFSEALRTVAKALRRVAEGKASAQAEAAEWKRKYELERTRNLQKEHKELSSQGHFDSKGEKKENASTQSLLRSSRNDQAEKCCGKNGICSHEVLRDGETDCDPKVVNNRFRRKASFRLSWGCNGSGQHKHDIVSFERGNITTAIRTSKQISLKWESQPEIVLILTKPNSNPVRILCAEMVRWLKDQKKINIFVEPRVRTELLAESSYFNFVQTWVDGEQSCVKESTGISKSMLVF